MVFFAVDNYLRICGRVRYSMILNVVTALLNIVLDFLFLVVFRWGVAAAAAASCLSIALGTVLGFLPFVMGRLPLRFVRGTISARQLGNILANGSSEFFSSMAGSVMMVILNSVLLRLSGSMAVAAFSIVMYVDSIVGSLLFEMCIRDRGKMWTRCATPARRPRHSCPISPWTARCSLTPPCPPLWAS